MGAPLLYQPTWFTDLGLTQSQFAADPYPHYERWRHAHPTWETAPGQWLSVRWEVARQVLTDAAFQKGTPWGEPPPEEWSHLPDLAPSMLGSNPPDHTRLRRLVTKAFQPRHIERLAPFITSLATSLIDKLRRTGGGDLVADLAFALPALVIAELMGVPAGDQAQFRSWSRDVIVLLYPSQPPDRRAAAGRSRWELLNYFDQLCREKAHRPQDDLLSELAAVEAEGDRLAPGELLSMALLLLVAGHETTTNLLSMGSLALASHPDALSHPVDWPSAVEELLRYTAPVQFDGRLAARDVMLDGHVVAAGSVVLVSIGAANRDPEAFSSPERLDLARRPNPHLAFGRGIHACLGAGLARLEAQIAMPLLWDAGARPRLAGSPEWNPNLVLRGLARLPVRFA